jgi:carboxylesterase type B
LTLSRASTQDQRAAMVWVQKFIHLFGGDKDKVAIFGCSAGAL